MKFYKMHGLGNDYIYFDCLDGEIGEPGELSQKLSDRHFGIGGDGIVLICPSKAADAKMRMFNADGSEGKMCGNAIRCVGKFLYDIRKINQRTLTIETLSGIKTLELQVADGVCTGASVNMGQPSFEPAKIPAITEKTVNIEINVGGKDYAATLVSVGNPHCVLFLEEDITNLDLNGIGPSFENHPMFPERINTEFVNVLGKDRYKMRVYERGSGETLACGTGATAVAAAAVANGLSQRNTDISVELLGGTLIINQREDGLYMTGPAELVYIGEIEI
ncbi:MAG TPA: diaminopimelate epimerase [Eubacteriales bacterium]|nr:diaminopimelate epimerase [Eubacteriales bacterium]HRU84583.1 diaminopimelate epimerase [Eubacteriales bacterium]